MQYQQLGRSDLHISKIGFGCMSLKPEATSETILHRALEAGINYFDTADLYDKGLNEELIGRTFKSKRDKVVIATKAGNQWRADGSGWDWNPRKKYILACAEKSLKRLQTDYIDLYQLHGGTMQDPIDETMEAFEILVQQGKIRYYGISSIRPVVIREWATRSNIVSVMTQYSLLDRRPEESSLPFLLQNNIGVVTRGSLAQGLLINKPAKDYLNYTSAQVQNAAAAVQSVSNANRNATQTALQFVLHHRAITSTIVGMRTMQQLEEAIKTMNTHPLSEKEMEQLQNAIAINVYKEHR
ncbi:MAG: aldo/keto reductase [Flavisolibacter sp.]